MSGSVIEWACWRGITHREESTAIFALSSHIQVQFLFSLMFLWFPPSLNGGLGVWIIFCLAIGWQQQYDHGFGKLALMIMMMKNSAHWLVVPLGMVEQWQEWFKQAEENIWYAFFPWPAHSVSVYKQETGLLVHLGRPPMEQGSKLRAVKPDWTPFFNTTDPRRESV